MLLLFDATNQYRDLQSFYNARNFIIFTILTAWLKVLVNSTYWLTLTCQCLSMNEFIQNTRWSYLKLHTSPKIIYWESWYPLQPINSKFRIYNKILWFLYSNFHDCLVSKWVFWNLYPVYQAFLTTNINGTNYKLEHRITFSWLTWLLLLLCGTFICQ